MTNQWKIDAWINRSSKRHYQPQNHQLKIEQTNNHHRKAKVEPRGLRIKTKPGRRKSNIATLSTALTQSNHRIIENLTLNTDAEPISPLLVQLSAHHDLIHLRATCTGEPNHTCFRIPFHEIKHTKHFRIVSRKSTSNHWIPSPLCVTVIVAYAYCMHFIFEKTQRAQQYNAQTRVESTDSLTPPQFVHWVFPTTIWLYAVRTRSIRNFILHKIHNTFIISSSSKNSLKISNRFPIVLICAIYHVSFYYSNTFFNDFQISNAVE